MTQPDHLSHAIELTGVLQEFRTIYIAGTFAILGFVIQRAGYRSNAERLIISYAFLLFALGNLFQTLQTAINIETLVSATPSFKYVAPWLAVASHLPFDIGVFLILLYMFKVTHVAPEAAGAAAPKTS